MNIKIDELINLPDDHPIFDSVAEALAHLCVNICLLVSPEKIILGGGVMKRTILYEKTYKQFKKLLNNYLSMEDLNERYISAPALNDD